MSVTLANLLKPALRMAGITKLPGITPSTDQYTELIPAMNRFLSSYSLDGLKIFQTSIDRYALTPQVGSYFIGPSGDFNNPRPIEIEAANLVWRTTSPELHQHIGIIREEEEWAKAALPDLRGIPRMIYYNPSAPDGRIYVWPIPSESNWDLELFTWTALKTDFSAVTDAVDLPDGYEEMITSNFALRIATLYPNEANVSDDTRILARNSLDAVRIKNATCPAITSEAAGAHGSTLPVNRRSSFYGWGSGL